MEILHWLQDVREHLGVSRRRNALRGEGSGVDYTADVYKGNVARVVSRIHPRRMRLRVVDIIQETPTTKTLRCVRSDDQVPPFRPGQYVNVFVDVDGVLTSRPYSIASPPPRFSAGEGIDGQPEEETILELTIRDNPGGFVAPYLLNETQIGDELETTGPEGNFYHEPLIDGDELVFLAGGSGITPFMSIIRSATRGNQDAPALSIHLLYGSRVPHDVIFGEELTKIAKEHSSIHYCLVISEPPDGYDGPTGFLDADLIRTRVTDVNSKTFYVCGPPAMHNLCLTELEKLGVPSHKIRRELYGPPADVTGEPGWPVGLGGDTVFQIEIVGREAIRVPAGEPLMNSLERYGIVVPAVCRTGACSACRTRLLSGRVFQPAHTGLRESDRENGYIHACVSYPLENLTIRL